MTDDPPDGDEILEGVFITHRIPCERDGCGHSAASHVEGMGACIAADCNCAALVSPTGDRADRIEAALRFEPRDKSTLRPDPACPDCHGNGYSLIPTVRGFCKYETCRRCRAISALITHSPVIA